LITLIHLDADEYGALAVGKGQSWRGCSLTVSHGSDVTDAEHTPVGQGADHHIADRFDTGKFTGQLNGQRSVGALELACGRLGIVVANGACEFVNRYTQLRCKGFVHLNPNFLLGEAIQHDPSRSGDTPGGIRKGLGFATQNTRWQLNALGARYGDDLHESGDDFVIKIRRCGALRKTGCGCSDFVAQFRPNTINFDKG
jgi:hypothetical protein